MRHLWDDRTYAQAFANHPKDKPIIRDTTAPAVMDDGSTVQVPIGRLVNKLRSTGWERAPEQELIEAMAAHGLCRALPDRMWRLKPSGIRVNWDDRTYAQAFANHPKDKPIEEKTTAPAVMHDGSTIQVPIGRLVGTLRANGKNSGWVKAPARGLIDAMAKHGLRQAPEQRDGRWRLNPGGIRVNWDDRTYAQAFAKHPVGTPIKSDTTAPVMMDDGSTVQIPIGVLMRNLRAGRRKAGWAPEQELINAMAAHGLRQAPPQSDRKWRLESAAVASRALSAAAALPYQARQGDLATGASHPNTYPGPNTAATESGEGHVGDNAPAAGTQNFVDCPAREEYFGSVPVHGQGVGNYPAQQQETENYLAQRQHLANHPAQQQYFGNDPAQLEWNPQSVAAAAAQMPFPSVQNPARSNTPDPTYRPASPSDSSRTKSFQR